jgi:hypothetical protein
MALTTEQRQRLYDALLATFLPGEFDELLFIRLGRPPHLVGPHGAPFPTFVTDVLLKASANEWEEELVVKAADAKPRNRPLRLLADEIEATPFQESLPQLERLLHKHGTMVKAATWRMEMEEQEARICKVILPTPQGRIVGTGFLVGPDLVMTNYHVVAPLLSPGSGAAVENVRLRFDYKTLKDGRPVEGVDYRLDAGDWEVLSSRWSKHDLEREPKSGVPSENELDFAIVRLASAAGNHAVGVGQAMSGSEPRGWVRIPDQVPALEKGMPLVMLQHPEGRPLEMAWAEVDSLNANGTRLKHRVDSQNGSSGSPIFDLKWTLVALHHSGDSDFSVGHQAAYNEAIPIVKIKEALGRGGVTLPA